jgi:hypothetical protein
MTVEALLPGRRAPELARSMLSHSADQLGLLAAFNVGELLGTEHARQELFSTPRLTAVLAEYLELTTEALLARALDVAGITELPLQFPEAFSGDGALSLQAVRDRLLAPESSSAAANVLLELLAACDVPCARYFLRALCGIPPIGIGPHSFLAALARVLKFEQALLERCYALTGSVEEVARRALQGRKALTQVQVRVGHFYRGLEPRPLLLSELERSGASPSLSGEWLVMRERTGVRVQLSRRHSTFRLLSWEGRELLGTLPELAGALLQGLDGDDELLLEGELSLSDRRATDGRSRLLERLQARRSHPLIQVTQTPQATLVLTDLLRRGREVLTGLSTTHRLESLGLLIEGRDALSLADWQPLESPTAPNLQDMLEPGIHSLLLSPPGARYPQSSTERLVRILPRPLWQVTATGLVPGPGGIVRVSVACRGPRSLLPLGTLTLGNETAPLRGQLEAAAAAYVVGKGASGVLLRPGLVLEVEPSWNPPLHPEKSSPARRALHLRAIRVDLGLAQVHTLQDLQGMGGISRATGVVG